MNKRRSGQLLPLRKRLNENQKAKRRKKIAKRKARVK